MAEVFQWMFKLAGFLVYLFDLASVLFSCALNPKHKMFFLLCLAVSGGAGMRCAIGSAWYGYAIILIYVGGVLILFSYVISSSQSRGSYWWGLLFLLLVWFCSGGVVLSAPDDANGVESVMVVLYENIFIYLFMFVYLLGGLLAVSGLLKFQKSPLRWVG